LGVKYLVRVRARAMVRARARARARVIGREVLLVAARRVG